ncbi:hypothetical protein Goshw_016442 [Gossypium schwendimanii]|uniref:Retrotransposon gag domain-containing protein n=1 Tax=Gossypium schwendimanii TaxID=34291 RepID=A0A7J9M4M2_GOSSC|nr:hypothetical protein [Gossypium schwendimanii]
MENYFRAKDIVDDAVKVNTALMFLIDIALLWWREKTTYKRQSDIGTWQEFQCELKEQFYPEFIKEEARAKLQGITQRGIVGEYNGLKSWVRHEVEQRGVQKLSEAMTIVESVVKLGLEKDKLRSSKSEERAYVKRITRKILLMAMSIATIVVMRNHELGRRNPRGKGTS